MGVSEAGGAGRRWEGFRDLWPEVHPEAWVHDSAVLIGDVQVGRRSTIWPGCVLRGDQGAIVIGQETSIQDGTIAHATAGWSTTAVGDRVTVGHRVVLHGCTVGSDCLIGMGAILLDGSEISAESMVGAGSLVPSGRRFPPRSLIMGSPARVVRQLSDDDIAQWIANGHRSYQVLGAIYGGWDG